MIKQDITVTFQNKTQVLFPSVEKISETSEIVTFYTDHPNGEKRQHFINKSALSYYSVVVYVPEA